MGALTFFFDKKKLNKHRFKKEDRLKIKRSLDRKVYSYLRNKYLKNFEQIQLKNSLNHKSRLFLVKDLIINLLNNQLLRRNLAFGFTKNQTHYGYYSRLVGFHDNVATINVSFLVYQLRKYFKLFLIALLKNQRFCFVAFETEMDPLEKKLFLFNYHVVLDIWLAGSISNYKKLSKQIVRTTSNFLKRIPQFVVTLGGMKPDKTHDITKEAYNAGLPIVNFLDTNIDLVPFSWYVPINTKHQTSINYFYFLLNLLIKRSSMIKKSHFLKKSKFRKKNVSKKKK